MSRSQTILNALVETRGIVSEIQSTDVHGAVLTLTRTSLQSITTAGTSLVWQSAIREYQIGWTAATSSITLPADGYYFIGLATKTSIAINALEMRVLRVSPANAVAVQVPMLGDVDRAIQYGSCVLYCLEDEQIRINVLPSANCDIVVESEFNAQESPILHIVQMSGDVDV